MGSNRSATLLLGLCPFALGSLAAGDADAQVKNDPKTLKRAETLLRGPGESVVREGANLCLQLNSAASMELLLDVLDKTQPHYRDIAWETLPAFTDPYARRRVELELKQNRKNPRVAQWCAQALGSFGEPSFGPTLQRALQRDELYIQAAAAQALGRIKFAPATSALEKLQDSADSQVRAYAMEALALIDPKAARERFDVALHDPDGGVRCFLLGAVPAIYPERSEDLAREFLRDEDWRPRAQAVENLAATRTKTAVDALVDASGDGRPAVAARANSALGKLSGMRFTLKAQWQEWWRVHRGAFEFPEGEAKLAGPEATSRATYNGMLVVSDHVAFVMDRSGDMSRASREGKDKDERALDELDATFSRLIGTEFTFNVFTYGGQFRAFKKEPVVLDKKTAKAAEEFVRGVTLTGSKAIWDVLTGVLEDPTLDTMYLLSSGEPEVGLYVHWNRVTDHLKELNRFHKVVIHTVAYTDSKWYQEQLQKIAEATGGEFKAAP